MDTNINILIQDGDSGGTATAPEMPGATPNPEAPETTKKTDKESDNALTLTKALAVGVGKQALSFVTSRVGTATRSSVNQTRVNAAMKLAGYTTGAGVSVATMNFKALALLAVSASVDLVGSVVDYNTAADREKAAYNVNAGRYSNVNRSR